MANVNEVLDEAILGVQRRRCLSNHILGLINRRQILDIVRYDAFDDLAVGRLEEAILIGTGIGCQRVNQADVGTFRCLNGAHPTVMCGVYVPHLKACALPG